MRQILFTVAFLCLFIPAALAAGKQAPLPDVKTIETYLNGITTLKARFVQTSSGAQSLEGTFLLKRPGRMRFDYAPPVMDFIVADGLLIYYYDGEMKQQSNTLISKSLADFFLRPELTLSGDIRVSEIKRADGLLQAALLQSSDPLAGSLTLMFAENPLQLKKWQVVDAQGLTTVVELFDAESGIKLGNELFHYYDPAQKKSHYNAN